MYGMMAAELLLMFHQKDGIPSLLSHIPAQYLGERWEQDPHASRVQLTAGTQVVVQSVPGTHHEQVRLDTLELVPCVPVLDMQQKHVQHYTLVQVLQRSFHHQVL